MPEPELTREELEKMGTNLASVERLRAAAIAFCFCFVVCPDIRHDPELFLRVAKKVLALKEFIRKFPSPKI